MAARSSNLQDWTSGANLQMEGHMDMPFQSQKDPKEMGVLGSSPSHMPSWSPARRLLPSHPNTRYCLGIHVTLTQETGAVPPPPHTWTLPLVEDMLCYARTGLTEAMVMGPGVGTWVSKQAYLAADPLTIQEGQWEIAWAITECQIKVRGPGHPCVNPSTPQPFRLTIWGILPKRTSLEMPIQTINYHLTSLWEARPAIDVEENRGYHYLSSPHHPWIAGSKVIGVQCRQPHWCCHCQTGPRAPHGPGKVENVGRPEPT